MALFKDAQEAWLILEDGTVFEGNSFGAVGTTIGEVVFTTCVTGYQETLTDSSYYGQIVTQTFPLIGNYGVNEEDYESNDTHLKGYIVREWCDTPSNFRCTGNINDFLKKHNVIGLYNIDTRALTRRLRESGAMNGMITNENPEGKIDAIVKELKEYKIVEPVKVVSVKEPEFYPAENAKYHVAIMDYGYKFSMREELIKRGCNVTVLPYNTTAEKIKELDVDGILLSSGPGDPNEDALIVENLKEIVELNIPMFGICLGHLLLGMANGAKCEKLLHGHHGENQPVTDIELGRTLITAQGHIYAIVNDSIPSDVGFVSHINANDKTCEGVKYTNHPAFSVQFHPEASGGPQDTAYMFDEFVDMIKKYREEK